MIEEDILDLACQIYTIGKADEKNSLVMARVYYKIRSLKKLASETAQTFETNELISQLLIAAIGQLDSEAQGRFIAHIDQEEQKLLLLKIVGE